LHGSEGSADDWRRSKLLARKNEATASREERNAAGSHRQGEERRISESLLGGEGCLLEGIATGSHQNGGRFWPKESTALPRKWSEHKKKRGGRVTRSPVFQEKRTPEAGCCGGKREKEPSRASGRRKIAGALISGEEQSTGQPLYGREAYCQQEERETLSWLRGGEDSDTRVAEPKRELPVDVHGATRECV